MRNTSKKNLKLIISLILVIVLQITLFSDGIFRQSKAEQDVVLSIYPKPKIDVILAKSRTDTDVEQFDAKLKQELRNELVDTSDLEIKSVEAETVNMQKTFDWNKDVDPSIGSIDINNNGQTVEFKGNQTNAGKNAMWVLPEGNQEQKFKFDYNIDFGDSFKAAGMLLRVKESGNNLTGYMLSFNKSGQDYYSLSSSSNGALWTFTYDKNHSTAMQKQFKTAVNISTNGNLTVTATDAQIKISGSGYNSGVGEFVYEIPENETSIIGNGYGFFSDHYGHNCASWGSFKLENINLEAATVKSFKDVLSVPDWRENAYKVLVYIEDYENEELKSNTSMAELLTRLLKEDIYFVGWGKDKNANQMKKIVKDNNDKGHFVNNTSLESSITQTAQYIKSILKTNDDTSQYLLLEEPISIQVQPEGIDTNTIEEPLWPFGKWKVIHDHNYFENPIGQFVDSNRYTSNMIKSFDKTGRYEIFYCDRNISPKYIYVHRKPVADMTILVSGTDVTLTSTSYDLDQKSKNNGIDQEEWKYKEVSDTNTDWIDQKLTTIDVNKTYIVQLRVKDWQGEWSAPATKYITRDSQALPVASFSLGSNKITKYENLAITDTSYDPAGRTITNWTWELYKGSSRVMQSNDKVPKIDFKSQGIGDYTLYLTVKNNIGQISERVGIPFKVSNDEIPPEFIAEPDRSEVWKQREIINLTFTDEGGSKFRGYQYAITDDQATPSNWNAEIKEDTGVITVDTEGQKYVHVRGYDNDNNESKERILGPYKIDHSNPEVQINADLNTHVTDQLVVNMTITDSLSGVKEVTIDGKPINHTLDGENNYAIQVNKNGTYKLKVEDVAGNIHEEDIIVNNIYQHCTADLGHPDYSTSLDSCPICDLIEGLEVTKETGIYNSQEQKVTYENPQDATIVEYYNSNKAKPIEVGEYNYELKVEYNGLEYNTGKTGTFTITPKDITITGIVATNREYNGTDVVEIHGGQLEGVEPSDIENVKFVLPQTGNTLDKNVGQHNVSIETITLEGTKAKNYNLIQPQRSDVSVEITKKLMAGGVRVEGIIATSREYNGTNIVELQRGVLLGIEGVDEGKVDYELSATGTTKSKDVGHYNVIIPTIMLTGEEAGNYEITQPTEDEVQVDITQKVISIKGITATNREYNGTNVVELQGGELLGVEEIDKGKVNFVLSATGTIENKNIGTYNVTIPEITLEGEEAKNYKLTQPKPEEVKVNITKKKINGGVHVEGITAISREYNGTNIVELHRGTLVGIEEADNDKVDYELSATGTTSSKDVGHYNVIIPTITLTGEEAGNYEITQPAEDEVQVDITQKVITIESITATNREYDGTDVVEIQGGALVGIEQIDENKVTFKLAPTGNTLNKNVGHYNVVIPEIILEGEESKNYTLTQPAEDEVQVDMTPKHITIEKITATSREYDGTDIVEIQGGSLVGIEEIDEGKVKFVLPTTGTIENKNVGKYNVIIPEIKLEGEEAKNYTLIQPVEDAVKIEIKQREITIEGIKGIDRKYDGTNIVEIEGGELKNVIEGDKVQAIIPKTGTIKEDGFGECEVTLEEIKLEGKDIENYKLIQPTGIKVKITKAEEPKIKAETYVSKINGKKVSKTNQRISYGDIIEITMKINNEGEGAGYIKQIENTIPNGMKFIENDKTNRKNGWRKVSKNLVETEEIDLEDEKNEIPANAKNFKEMKLVLQVIDKTGRYGQVKNTTSIEQTDIGKEDIAFKGKTELPIKISYSDLSIGVAIKDISRIGERSSTGNGNNVTIQLGDGEESPQIRVTYEVTINNTGNAKANLDNIIAVIPRQMNEIRDEEWVMAEEGILEIGEVGEIKAGGTKKVKLTLEGNVDELYGIQKTQLSLESKEDIDQIIEEKKDGMTEESIKRLLQTNNTCTSTLQVTKQISKASIGTTKQRNVLTRTTVEGTRKTTKESNLGNNSGNVNVTDSPHTGDKIIGYILVLIMSVIGIVIVSNEKFSK